TQVVIVTREGGRAGRGPGGDSDGERVTAGAVGCRHFRGHQRESGDVDRRERGGIASGSRLAGADADREVTDPGRDPVVVTCRIAVGAHDAAVAVRRRDAAEGHPTVAACEPATENLGAPDL